MDPANVPTQAQWTNQVQRLQTWTTSLLASGHAASLAVAEELVLQGMGACFLIDCAFCDPARAAIV